MNGDLLAATQVFFSGDYHNNGQTYYPFPNAREFVSVTDGTPCRSSFGLDAMRHLLILQKW